MTTVPDANQVARIASYYQDAEYQVFLGGPRDLDTAQAQALSGITNTEVATTSTGTQYVGTDTLNVVSTAGFRVPSVGATCTAAAGTAGSVSMFTYTGVTATALTGVVWYKTGVVGGAPLPTIYTIAAGTPVVQVYNISDSWRVANYEQGWQPGQAESTQSATLEGTQWESGIMQPGAQVIIQARYYPDGAAANIQASAWRDVYRGYILERPQLTYTTSGEAATWKVRCGGIADLLKKYNAAPQTFGSVNLARGKSVAVSSALADPYVLVQEGEGLSPTSADGGNLTDGAKYTLWSTQSSPAVTNAPTTTGIKIQGAYFWPAASDFSLLQMQWFHVYNGSTTDYGLKDLAIARPGWESHDHLDPNYLQQFQWPANTQTLKAKQHMIVCYDATAFTRHWSVPQDTLIVETKRFWQWSNWAQDSGYVALVYWLGGEGGIVDALLYGSYTTFNNPHSNWDHTTQPSSQIWVGAAVPVPLTGKGLQRTQLGNDSHTASDWTATYDMSPGASPYSVSNTAYATMNLTQFPAATLASDIAATGTLGEVVVATGGSTGNYLESGTFRVDNEEFHYMAKTPQSFGGTITRAYNGTAMAAHSAGAAITQVYPASGAGRLAGNYYWIGSVALKRWKQTGTPSYPQYYYIRIATDPDAGSGDKQRDITTNLAPGATSVLGVWKTVAYANLGSAPPVSITGSMITLHHTLPAPVQAQHIGIVIQQMNTISPARLNEIEVYQATNASETMTVTNTAEAAKAVLESTGLYPVLDSSGNTMLDSDGNPLVVGEPVLVPEEIQANGAGQPLVKGLQVVSSSAWNQVVSIMQRGRGVAVCDLLNRVRFEDDPFMPTTAYPPVAFAWDEDTLGRGLQIAGQPIYICAQVKLTVISVDEGEAYTVVYPPQPNTFGEIVSVSDKIVGSVDQARFLVRYLYAFYNRGWKFKITAPGIIDGLDILQRHTITAHADNSDVYFNAMNVLVTAIRVHIERDSNGRLVTSSSIDAEQYPII